MNPVHGASDSDDAASVVSEHLDGSQAEAAGSPVAEDEGEGDDLFGDDYLRDYEPDPELDYYEQDDLVVEDVTHDAANHEEIEARRRAEEALDARDRVQFRRSTLGNRRPNTLPETRISGLGGGTAAVEEAPPVRRRRVETLQAGDLPEEDDESGERLMIDFQDARSSLRDWVQQPRVKVELDALFRRFVRSYRNSPEEIPLYESKIRDLITYSRTSLVVDFFHMANFSRVLYHWTVLQPKAMLEVFNKAAYDLVCERQSNFSLLWSKEVYVRFENIPVEEKLRGLTKDALETLIYIKGVVTRRTSVFPQLKQVMYDCQRCGNILGPFFINDDKEFKPDRCPNCQSKGPMAVNVQNTIYGNYQKLTLQESPGEVPPGMVPRQKEVILQQDLIDCARPGDEVTVCGIYTHTYDAALNKKCGFPVFKTTIEANNVIRQDALSSVLQLTDAERQEIVQLSKDPRISERIFKSIAPSIHGHEYIKMAIALSLFGGNEKRAGLHQMRGDINVLLLGDPGMAQNELVGSQVDVAGTGKSQFLKYVQKAAQRSVYNNGKGASAVGLTAAVQKDPVTREWTLEGGALVLADRGICLIDEFDKMNDQDRVSIHEAMEQQSISISKAGIVTQLQARCGVIAAANPIGGKYDIRLPFSQNVMLEDPIISRFDCLCVVRDIVDQENDGRLAQFLLGVHSCSHPDERKRADEVESAYERGQQEEAEMDTDEVPQQSAVQMDDPDLIPQDLLKKYIVYAKTCAAANLQNQHEFGNSHDPMEQRIVDVYSQLRQESHSFDGVNITVRHLESIIRMAEAHAKMHLRDRVQPEDVDMGVRMMVETFITTQKFSVQRGLRRKLQRYLNKGRNLDGVLLEALEEAIRDVVRDYRLKGQAVPPRITLSRADAERRARQLKCDLQRFFGSVVFLNSSLHYDDATQSLYKDVLNA